MLGTGERINIRWQYGGHLKTIIVDAGTDGHVRGFISPRDLMAYEGGTQDIFGDGGRVTVVRTQEGQVVNDGVAEARLHNAVDDLAFFFCTSDQVETGMCVMIGLAADVRKPIHLCQGVMIQALPGCDLTRFNAMRMHLAEEQARDLMTLPTEADTHFESVLNAITKGVSTSPGVTIGRSLEPVFRCTCSKDKMGHVVRTLAETDRTQILEKGEALEIVCQFCNQHYVIGLEDCRHLWQAT